MSRPSWLNSLTRALQRLPQSPPRVAIVGVGHELRGDDAAGVAVARALAAGAGETTLVIDGGPAPENYTGLLRRFSPHLVLLIDAAEMGEEPGSVRYLPWQEAIGLSASTHTLPLSILAHYLTSEFGCEVALIGIQPARTTLGEPLSPVVQQAVDAVVQGVLETFTAHK